LYIRVNHATALAHYTLSLHDALPISDGHGEDGYDGKCDGTGCSGHWIESPSSRRTASPLTLGSDIARLRPRRIPRMRDGGGAARSEEHTSELQSRVDLVCRLLLETKK